MTRKLKYVAIRNLITVFDHQSGDEVIVIKVCFIRKLSSMAPRSEFIVNQLWTVIAVMPRLSNRRYIQFRITDPRRYGGGLIRN